MDCKDGKIDCKGGKIDRKTLYTNYYPSIYVYGQMDYSMDIKQKIPIKYRQCVLQEPELCIDSFQLSFTSSYTRVDLRTVYTRI